MQVFDPAGGVLGGETSDSYAVPLFPPSTQVSVPGSLSSETTDHLAGPVSHSGPGTPSTLSIEFGSASLPTRTVPGLPAAASPSVPSLLALVESSVASLRTQPTASTVGPVSVLSSSVASLGDATVGLYRRYRLHARVHPAFADARYRPRLRPLGRNRWTLPTLPSSVGSLGPVPSLASAWYGPMGQARRFSPQ